MATLTIRKIDDDLKRELRLQAAQNQRSMEDEVRHILRDAVARSGPAENMADRLRRRFADLQPVDLPLHGRPSGYEPPDLG